MERMQALLVTNRDLESTITKLRILSQESQTAVALIIDVLAPAEGVSGHADCRLPITNLDLWLTKLRSERKSEGNTRLYEYLARRFFKRTPSHDSPRGATARIGARRTAHVCHDLARGTRSLSQWGRGQVARIRGLRKTIPVQCRKRQPVDKSSNEV